MIRRQTVVLGMLSCLGISVSAAWAFTYAPQPIGVYMAVLFFISLLVYARTMLNP